MSTDHLQRIVDWARAQSDIDALVLTGSRARDGGLVDEFSDLDLEIFTIDPDRYTSSDAWMGELGRVWVYLPLVSSRSGYPTRLIIFEGGAKVDFTIKSAEQLEEVVRAQRISELYERGYRVLVDRRGLAARLPPPTGTPRPRTPPTEARYRATIDEFWFEAWHIPAYLQRGDLWVVKYRDWTMKEMLLRMLEWHAGSTPEPADVWQAGRDMKRWVRPDIWERLHSAFARFDTPDSWRALLETMSLFRDVAIEVGEELGYAYPQDVDDAISAYVRRFEGRF